MSLTIKFHRQIKTNVACYIMIISSYSYMIENPSSKPNGYLSRDEGCWNSVQVNNAGIGGVTADQDVVRASVLGKVT